jgi:hypothetical protein
VRPTDFRPFVPVEPDPAESIKDAPHRVFDVPLEIGIVDSQNELATVLSSQQPVE